MERINGVEQHLLPAFVIARGKKKRGKEGGETRLTGGFAFTAVGRRLMGGKKADAPLVTLPYPLRMV